MLESYVDLIGNYSVDTATGKIELVNKGELRETEGFQGAGDFEIDEHGRLLLAGICPTEPDLENPD
jgi:hypothetical protein